MKTVDSLATSTDASVLGGSLSGSQSAYVITGDIEHEVSSDKDFEQVIDLSVTNRNFEESSIRQEDLYNLNTTDNCDNSSDINHPAPIIAFEDNATRRHEITGKKSLY